MKLIFVLLSLVSFNTFASGCMPDDVQLASETAIASIGKFEAHDLCQQGYCQLSVYNQEKNEYHVLYNLESNQPLKINTVVELKVYDQYFVSSCAETHRYVLGVDIDGKRFRSEFDLDSL